MILQLRSLALARQSRDILPVRPLVFITVHMGVLSNRSHIARMPVSVSKEKTVAREHLACFSDFSRAALFQSPSALSVLKCVRFDAAVTMLTRPHVAGTVEKKCVAFSIGPKQTSRELPGKED